MKKGQGESPGNRVNKSSQSTVNGEGPVVRVNQWGEKADYDSSKKSEWGGRCTEEGCQDGKIP